MSSSVVSRGNDGLQAERKLNNPYSLLALPIVLFYEICQYLHPQTLLVLCRVNHLLRDTLSSTESSAMVWCIMRGRYNVPPPFTGRTGLSEYEWAELLFGPPCCQMCGGLKQDAPSHSDLVFQQRLCLHCSKNSTIHKTEIREGIKHGVYPKNILHYVAASPGYFPTGSEKLYDRKELQTVMEQISRQKGLSKDGYLQNRKDHTNAFCKHVYDCSEWRRSGSYSSILWEGKHIAATGRFNSVMSRLTSMGYSEKDVECVKELRCVRKYSLLSEEAWIRIQPELLRPIKNVRLREFFHYTPTSVMIVRREMLRRVYADFLKSLPPGTWASYPPFLTLSLFPPMFEILVSPDNNPVTETQLQNILHGEPLQSDLTAYVTSVERNVARVVKSSSSLSEIYSSVFSLTELQFPSKCHKSATVVIECALCFRLWVSTASFIQHPCCYYGWRGSDSEEPPLGSKMLSELTPLVANKEGRAAMSLISASGLDVVTTTADELDELGKFYKCLTQKDKDEKEYSGTWRECVIHFFGFNPANPHRLHEARDGDIQRWFEMLGDSPERKDERCCWSCGHCNEHVDALVTREVVLEHLRAQHYISEPHVPNDFFHVVPSREECRI
ncbi:hypothetical protein E1B28_012935 [Marasmius oreades]|uniref:F-box domain-containing protein n=1 Tax=Marasmius oreades TaxID=181124 RepID=A0A9P7RSK9_9AGAR|nr:uncharacterized protein E1B28_012935 [Marasmius oreades]KAG7088989.1 hypothetical protein E1B28_012935 [Marasmius oreades]